VHVDGRGGGSNCKGGSASLISLFDMPNDGQWVWCAAKSTRLGLALRSLATAVGGVRVCVGWGHWVEWVVCVEFAVT
jgi:hypothetical protein